MNRELRVLAISDWFPNNVRTTSGIFVYNQLNRLADCGAEISVVCPVPWSPPIVSLLKSSWRNFRIDRNVQIGCFEVEYPRYFRLPGLWFNSCSGIACYIGIRNVVKNIYRRSPFDIIYANAIIPCGYASCILAHELRVPILCYVGEAYVEQLYSREPIRKKVEYVINGSTKIVSASRSLRDQLLKIACPLESIEVLYRGTDIDVFKPLENNSELKRRLSLPEGSLVITFVGSLEERKGVSDLVNAFSIIADRLPQTYLMIVGDGPERNNLKALSKKTGIGKRVIFTGLVKNEEMPSYHSITDVMAFPSYKEGLPNAVVEAVACGKPVVATNIDGIPEVITSGINGFLVKVGDIKGLSSSIMQILTDAALREKMGQKSRQIAEAHFNGRKNAENLVNLFRQIIEEYETRTKPNFPSRKANNMQRKGIK